MADLPKGEFGKGEFGKASRSQLADLRPTMQISSRPLVLAAPDAESGWKEVPAELADGAARIYDQGYHKHVGVAQFEVVAAGRVYVIGNWHYQGSGGSWEKERLKQEGFTKNGWKRLREPLVKKDGDTKDVYYRDVEVGEALELRTNKYTPPFFMCRAKR